MDDHRREIVSVVWKELGERVEMIYAEGEPDRVRGSELVAANIARGAGLTLVPSREGMSRWVKDPSAADR